jgi:hypothetical protein
MPWVGFEPKIPMLERAKTVHALDRATTVMGSLKGTTSLRRFRHYIIHDSIVVEAFIKSITKTNHLNN